MRTAVDATIQQAHSLLGCSGSSLSCGKQGFPTICKALSYWEHSKKQKKKLTSAGPGSGAISERYQFSPHSEPRALRQALHVTSVSFVPLRVSTAWPGVEQEHKYE